MQSTQTTENIKAISSNKSEIDFTKLIVIEKAKDETGDLLLGKIIVESKDSNRRVEEKCEVKYNIQKYLCLKSDGSLNIINKDYKSIFKKKIDKMDLNEKTTRWCLLNLSDDQTAWFVIHKIKDDTQYKLACKSLKLDDNTTSDYEDFLYYKISVNSVTFDQPAEPKAIQNYENYIKKYVEEVRYHTTKENYSEALSWANAIISKYFNMSKELKKQLTDDLNKKFLPLMKIVFSNKSLCLWKKPSNEKFKDYEQIINLVEKEYYKYYQNEKDDIYIKVTGRLAKSYLNMKDLEKCEKTLNELKLCAPDQEVVKDLEEKLIQYKSLNQQQQKRKIMNYFSSVNSLKNQENYDDDAIEWDYATENLDLSCKLDESIINSFRNV